MFLVLLYDVVYMVVKFVKGVKILIDFKKVLVKLKDFKGVIGKMFIDKNYNVVKLVYVVKLDDGKISSVNIILVK